MISVKDSTITLEGDWVLPNLAIVKEEVERLKLSAFSEPTITIDGTALTLLDTSGSYTLSQLIKTIKTAGADVALINFTHDHQTLLAFITERMAEYTPEGDADKIKHSLLYKVGEQTIEGTKTSMEFLSFIGEVSISLMQSFLKPWNIRWKALWSNVQTGGWDALLIIGLLNFLIGLVIAYQGGALLRNYGANIFIVELTAISMIRELAPLITAIIVAGRTGSAFAAQIGTMVVNEEVDALKTIGINPLDQLVTPKLLALIIALPFLTIFADIMSVFGGMVLAKTYLDVSFAEFIDRIPQIMTINTLLVGLAKTPIFAIIIALTGCYQGFKVEGGADSVGKQTTKAVVQSIFLVIICDAFFSIVTRNVGL